MENEFLKTKKEINKWLDKHKVGKYTLVKDSNYGYVVNVEGEVDLSNKNLECIPIKLNIITGSFNCSHNKLTSLQFCPTKVGGSFYCYDNQLTTLEFCPTFVGRDFYCHSNFLKSLEFCPQEVGVDFICDVDPSLGTTEHENPFADILKIHQKIVNIKKEKASIEAQLLKVPSGNMAHRSVLKV